jgi:hypothetical protein
VSVYVSLAQFKDYCRADSSIGGADDATLQAALDAAEESVNSYCQRTFAVASVTPSARSYSPYTFGSSVLFIHDCTTITSVTEWGQTVTTDQYIAEPYAPSLTGMQKPFDRLTRYRTWWTWDYGKPQIIVTATWGWAATPSKVIEATKILAKDIYSQRNVSSGIAGFGEYGAVRVRTNPIAMGMLDSLRRSEALGI